MAKFCTYCGSELNYQAKFCGKCGMEVVNQTNVNNPSANSSAAYNVPLSIGFSDRINNPEVINTIDERKKRGRGCIFIGIPLPLIILLIVSYASEELGLNDALVFGGGLSFVFLIIYINTSIISNAKRSWDGIVVNKKTKNRSRRYSDGDVQNYTEYIIYFRTDSGKKKLSVNNSMSSPEYRDYYDYLNVGDRVRYHPHLSFMYEKYDKTKDKYIPCMFCKTMNDIHSDRCEDCNNLLFK